MPLPETLKKYQFGPGNRANPGGRPKGIAAKVKELVGNNGEDCLAFLAEVMRGEVKGAKIRDRVDATKELLARGFGRPIDIQAHTLIGDAEGSEEVRALASDALLKLAAATAPPALTAGQITVDALPERQDASVTQAPPTSEKTEASPLLSDDP